MRVRVSILLLPLQSSARSYSVSVAGFNAGMILEPRYLN